MAYQETKIPDALRLTEYQGKPLIAYFIGSKTVDTKFGEQMLHEFEKEDHSKLSVWGFTALNRLLDYTPKGVLCKVTYTGLSKEKNKYGKQVHTCTVFFDEDKKLDNFKEPEIDQTDNQDLPF